MLKVFILLVMQLFYLLKFQVFLGVLVFTLHKTSVLWCFLVLGNNYKCKYFLLYHAPSLHVYSIKRRPTLKWTNTRQNTKPKIPFQDLNLYKLKCKLLFCNYTESSHKYLLRCISVLYIIVTKDGALKSGFNKKL